VTLQTIQMMKNNSIVQNSKQSNTTSNLPIVIFTARCYASVVYAVMQCPSVRPSDTFVDHVKTNKRIFEIFSPSGSDTILVFPPKRGADIPTRTPLMGASNARGL